MDSSNNNNFQYDGNNTWKAHSKQTIETDGPATQAMLKFIPLLNILSLYFVNICAYWFSVPADTHWGGMGRIYMIIKKY